MAHLIHIGNSLGVRIPKAIITQVGFKEDTPLEFKITGEGLLISPTQRVRLGWDEAFKNASEETALMGEDIVNAFDRDDWEW
jgi:antitoxin component of MazEF toxin-antitoxin module